MSENAPRRRPSASERRANTSRNPYLTTSASQRRAQERARSAPKRSGETTVPRARETQALSREQIAELLEHPTRDVPEAELRREYSYVLTDVRNMALLAVSLVIFMIALALLLPQ